MACVDDIAIIGGGPCGLFGLYHAHMRGVQARLFESLPALGGQVTSLYPDKEIFDIGGMPRVTGRDLVARLEEQCLKDGQAICLGEQVLALTPEDDVFRLHTSDGEHRARSVVIAAGLGAFRPRRIGVPGEEEFAGRGVDYIVDDLGRFTARRILVVGGGDSALDWANTLAPMADVRLVHNLPKWQAHEESVQRMQNSGIWYRQPWELRSIEGEGRVQEVVVGPVGSDACERIPVDQVLICIGFRTDLGPIKSWGLPIRGGQIQVDWGMRTGVDGIFAAGDVATYPGKQRLIALGFGEVGLAVDSAVRHLFPQQRLITKHSSDRGF